MSDGTDTSPFGRLAVRGPHAQPVPDEIGWAVDIIVAYLNGFTDGARKASELQTKPIDDDAPAPQGLPAPAGRSAKETRAKVEAGLAAMTDDLGSSAGGRPCTIVTGRLVRSGMDVVLLWGPGAAEWLELALKPKKKK
ncbi:hypothetical protein JIG36_36830 [Actinoplanes sp. LDG1-06]|uniref:Uncharacterized protein n=1 Tax=Paractinoplanes ovalisporus TaxID=2810368 RepID=A0ABS2APA4_9ACTN|nr:hypothetical protein [Actinoplanes ovalisporus]MBM2621081.1 hypothetical protein [Actinoplanes ovalisporus]